jgi:benzoyl-CoA reductase/2-hydroxyglutaryl-CoA dehydratase subunit BcrC/BadD/HgdB
MEGLRYFEEVASLLENEEIRAWKKSGRRVVGTVCANIPEEILQAAGVLPVRLRAPGMEDTAHADAHMHRINCSYTRSILELLLSDQLGFLDGLVTTNTCDHMLRLASELEANGRFPFVHAFSMYHAMVPASTEWFLMEMRKMIEHVEASFGTKVSDQDLCQSINAAEHVRELMTHVNELRKEDPPRLSGAEFLTIALAGMSVPKERFCGKLEALIPELEQRQPEGSGLPRLMVIGGGCDAPAFIDFIETTGAWVVADSLCFATRFYMGSADEEADEPIRAIANRYAHRLACPSVMNAFRHNCGLLTEMIRDWRVDGVVCARLKFCDHWAGFRNLLTEALRQIDVPVLELEREYQTTGSGQIRTRVQAFLEMLRPSG